MFYLRNAFLAFSSENAFLRKTPVFMQGHSDTQHGEVIQAILSHS
jgi:hypothetical protein